MYLAIRDLHDTKKYPVTELCKLAGIQRSSYYKWLNRKEKINEKFNKELIPLIKDAYEERNGILGYRQMTLKLNREHNLKVNHKRIYRLMDILKLKSVCRKKRKNYIKSTPEITADNILNRDFKSNQFGEKWLTDVTEMKYGSGGKAYLSAILDLADKSIVSFVLGHSNNNKLVFDTFDIAHSKYPNSSPIFHSDRGYQYTSKTFKKKLDEAGMIQSMSRVSRCIDNGPMEAFWGMLKSEMYYLKKFNTYTELESAV
ncbi:IS3 family transposase, partial [Tissierella pigra]